MGTGNIYAVDLHPGFKTLVPGQKRITDPLLQQGLPALLVRRLLILPQMLLQHQLGQAFGHLQLGPVSLLRCIYCQNTYRLPLQHQGQQAAFFIHLDRHCPRLIQLGGKHLDAPPVRARI